MFTVEEGLNSFVLKKDSGVLGIEETKNLLSTLGGKVNYLTIQDFSQNPAQMELKVNKRTKNLGIEISPDCMKAFVSYIEKPDAEDIIEELSREGIKTAVSVEEITIQLNNNVKRIMVAKGIEPEKSIDEKINWHVSFPESGLSVAKRENVDYYNLDLFTYVNKGDKIATITPAIRGTPGENIFGKTLCSPPPKRLRLRLSRDYEMKDGAIYVKNDGVLQLKNDRLELEPVLRISGDIDYKTGNIDSNINVQISGWVRTGFSVSSKKNVFVEGGIEEKTLIKTGGDISVVLGIMGNKKTEVEVGGDLKAKFIQDSTIFVKKNIYVNEYIMNSDVVCEGSVYVNGRKGSIINSSVDAKVSVELKNYLTSKKEHGIKVKGFHRALYLKTLKELQENQIKLKGKLSNLTIKLRGTRTAQKELLQSTLNEYNQVELDLNDTVDLIDEIKVLLKKVEGEGMVKFLSPTEKVRLKIKGQEIDLFDSEPMKIYYDIEKRGIVKKCLA